MKEMARRGPQVGSARTGCREPGYTLARRGFTKWNATREAGWKAEWRLRGRAGCTLAGGLGGAGAGALATVL